MNRGRMREFIDRNLKPNKDDEDRILTVLSSPLGKPSSDQLELLWHFRYYLRRNKKALTKVWFCALGWLSAWLLLDACLVGCSPPLARWFHMPVTLLSAS